MNICFNDTVHVPKSHACEILHPLQDGDVPLHFAALGDNAAFVKCLVSAAGIDVNIKNKVSGFPL